MAAAITRGWMGWAFIKGRKQPKSRLR